MKAIYFLPVICLFFLVFPAAAVQEVNQYHVQQFNVPTTDGLSLTGLELSGLDPTSTTNLTFDSYGQKYYLNITSDKTWGWWTWDLSLKDPDGNIQNKHLSVLAPACSSWKCHVQYYYLEADTIFDLDVYASLLPLSANISTPNPTLSEALEFSNIQGSSTSFYDAKLYLSSYEEFQAQQQQEIIPQITKAATDVFSWSWNSIISFLSSIPYIGEYIDPVLILTTLTLSSIIFYTKLLFIDYAETTFLTIEFFILSYAFGKNGSFWTQISRVVKLHVKFIEMIMDTSRTAINLFGSVINVVTSIIQSLKPI